jgi:ribonuclease J
MFLNIHRGTREIGGTCIEVGAGSTRLVLDAGLPLVNAAREAFDPKSLRGKNVTELVQDGLLPPVPGLFAEDVSLPAALLLSHVHLDHTGLLPYIRPKVPIVLSKGTSKMLLAGSIFSGMPSLDRSRGLICEPERPLTIGDFRITAYPVDHSAFDSMAFLIEAGGKTILYSGDLRLHGRKPGMARNLIKAVRSRVDILLMEGTHVGSGRERGCYENELEQQILTQIQGARGVVFASFSPMHVDRLVTFYKATQRAGRTFVLDPYGAFVMHLVSGQCRIPRPTRHAGIRVWYNAYFESSYKRRNLHKIHRLFAQDRIELAEIFGHPQRYVLLFRPSMMELDFGGILPQNACCIYSYWNGYLNKPEWQELQTKLADAGGQLVVMHTSGHIFADDIVAFVRAINPGQVIPIHTFNPYLYRDNFPNARILNDHQMVELV